MLAREADAVRPAVMFENSHYYFKIDVAGELVPFGPEATNPILVNTCEQEIARLGVSWEPVEIEKILAGCKARRCLSKFRIFSSERHAA
jgi:hypothetical protein